ncbi:carbon-nitrogen hydrolase family protein [Pseudoalteromonas xiamenensis]
MDEVTVMDISKQTSFKVAAAQYPVSAWRSWDEYKDNAELWCQKAVDEGAQILLFPEYAAMELSSLLDPLISSDLHKQLPALQQFLSQFTALFEKLAIMHQVLIQPGTFPVLNGAGEYRNRAFLFGPEGLIGYQDKLQMTRFELESWNISAGAEINTFTTHLGVVAIAICYDSEFPLLVRQQVEAGAEVILVPSCTDTLAGFHRVKVGSQARALENQIYVVQSCTVGDAPWSPALDINIGAAAIYEPIDIGFKPTGIQVIGNLNVPQWVFGTCDLTKIRQVRQSGQVLNHRDWSKQVRFNLSR